MKFLLDSCGGMELIRLDKFLCDANVGTRSEVKELLKRGRVTVDGSVVQKADFKVAEGKNVVCLDKKPLTFAQKVYYLLNKPAGVVSASRDRREKTALDLLKGAPGRDLFLVGRLDKDTEGLLLLTNEGSLAHALLSPKRHVDKVYYARVEGCLNETDQAAFAEGLSLSDGLQCLPAELEILPESGGTEVLVTLREGKFHQVKRMLASRGAPVVYLERVQMAGLTLDRGLPRGGFRFLTEDELAILQKLV